MSTPPPPLSNDFQPNHIAFWLVLLFPVFLVALLYVLFATVSAVSEVAAWLIRRSERLVHAEKGADGVAAPPLEIEIMHNCDFTFDSTFWLSIFFPYIVYGSLFALMAAVAAVVFCLTCRSKRLVHAAEEGGDGVAAQPLEIEIEPMPSAAALDGGENEMPPA